MKLTREEFHSICEAAGILMNPLDQERLFDALTSYTRPKTKPKKTNVGQEAVAAYCNAFADRYETTCRPTPMECKRLKDLAVHEGVESAIGLIQAFFEMNDAWFIQKGHAVHCLLNDLNKVRIYRDTKKHTTTTQARRLERRAGNRNAFAKLLEGKS